MSWLDIENAMQKAVVRASGLDPSQVVWSYQNVNAPDQDYVEIHFGGETAIGIDWVRNSQNLARPVGQEIKQEIHGIREVPFEVTCFTADTLGAASARRLAELIRTKLRLDSVRQGIRAAGVSPFDSDPVSYIPDIPAGGFRGRAMVTIRCYVPVMDCFEYVGYIARVRGIVYPSGLQGGPSSPTGFAFDSANAP